MENYEKPQNIAKIYNYKFGIFFSIFRHKSIYLGLFMEKIERKKIENFM